MLFPALVKNTDEIEFMADVQSVIDAESITIGGEMLNATELFLPFFRQPLYPLISVDLVNNELKIKRADRPFLHNPDSELSPAEFGYKYSVVLRWTHTDEQQILGLEDGELTISYTGNALVKLNKGQTGYYRVKYDGNLRSQIIEQLNSDKGCNIFYRGKKRIVRIEKYAYLS